jgi:hypothetical protein
MDEERQFLQHGDRVVSAHDLDTTQGFRIPKGAEGTVTEDRGSNLVVFFEDQAVVARLTETDLAKAAG